MGDHQWTNTYSMRVSEEGEKGVESLFKEIMARNVPNLGKESDNQI